MAQYRPRGGRVGTAERVQKDPAGALVIQQAAAALQLNVVEFTALMSFESAGTLNPNLMGGDYYRYKGLIQFSPDNQRKYGTGGQQSISEQMPAVVRYLRDRGFKPGQHDIRHAYSAILVGTANENYRDSKGRLAWDIPDSNDTTVRNAASRFQRGPHYNRAIQFLRDSGINPSVLPQGGGGFLFDLFGQRTGIKEILQDLNNTLVPVDFFYRCKNDYSKGVIPVQGRTSNPKELWDIEPTIYFNVITGRLPFSVDVISKDFTIEKQIPVEFIRFLAAQEPYPTELFQNHLDGNLYYSPRVNDVSGLADSKRFYRTYYYRTIPGEVSVESIKPTFEAQNIEGELTERSGLDCQLIPNFDYEAIFAEVDYNQMLINFKEEQSTHGMKTNFFIANQSPNGTTAGNAIIMHMAARPAFLRGVELGGRNIYIEDPTIKSIGEAAAVAASAARLYAKELRQASCTVLGDPSLTAGELVQIINSPLYPQSLQRYIDEREAVKEYEAMTRAHYMSVVDVTRKGINDQNEESAPIKGNYSAEDPGTDLERPDQTYQFKGRQAEFKDSAEDVYCSVTNPETATVVEGNQGWEGDNYWRKSGFKKEPQSMWRIEGVRHTLNSGGQQGWLTELVLLAPY